LQLLFILSLYLQIAMQPYTVQYIVSSFVIFFVDLILITNVVPHNLHMEL